MLGKKGKVNAEIFNICTDLNFNHDIPCTIIAIDNDGWLLCKFPFQHESMHNGRLNKIKLADGDFSEDNDSLWIMEKYVEVVE